MWWRGLSLGFFGTASAVLGFQTLGGGTFHLVEGESMRPTLNPALGRHHWIPDVVYVRRIANSAAAEDLPLETIVCLRHPRRPHDYLIKRLVAKEGEPVPGGAPDVPVPPGHCWVTSDAGKGYLDSSFFGAVPLSQVLGEVRAIVFPPTRMKRLSSASP